MSGALFLKHTRNDPNLEKKNSRWTQLSSLVKRKNCPLKALFKFYQKSVRCFSKTPQRFLLLRIPLIEANALRSLMTNRFYFDQFCNHEERFNKILQCLWGPKGTWNAFIILWPAIRDRFVDLFFFLPMIYQKYPKIFCLLILMQ